MNNNPMISAELNDKLKYVITKQTNLICIIAFFTLVQGIMSSINIDTARLRLIFVWINIIGFNCVILICIIFTFKGSDLYYSSCCKYSHLFFNYLCRKPNSENNTGNKNALTPLLPRNSISIINLSKLSVDHDASHIICEEKDQCKKIDSICKLMKQHNENNSDISKFMCNNGYSVHSILNDFNHLLSFHDSDEEYNNIYQSLHNDNNACCQYTNCRIFSRHYSRRMKNRQRIDQQKQNDLSPTRILDKIHSFYYHSYDTLFRRNFSLHEDTRDAGYIHMFKSNNVETFQHNKFISNWKDMKLTGKTNIFSFGKRFEYEDQNNEWFVKAKFKSLKDELVNNKMCSISIDIYNEEYDKCLEYMKTDYVKTMQNRNKQQLLSSYILSLLVYCNCDEYQTKWSESFRRIPS
eukprot:226122_1